MSEPLTGNFAKLATKIAERQTLENRLIDAGRQHAHAEQEVAGARAQIRELLTPSRASGISMLEISRLTGISPQTLHAWQRKDQDGT